MRELQRKRGGRATGSVAKKAGNLMFLVLMIVALSAMMAMPAMAHDVDVSIDAKPDVFIVKGLVCDWSINKSANPTSLMIKPGEYAEITYTIDIDSTVVSVETLGFLGGALNVGNTTGSDINVTLQVTYLDEDSAPIGEPEVLDPILILAEETGTVPFEAELDPPVDAVDCKVQIIDVSAVDCSECSVGFDSGEVDCSTEVEEFCGNPAVVTDVVQPLEGFKILNGEKTFDPLFESAVLTHTVVVKNESAPCGKTFDLVNIATLETFICEKVDEEFDFACDLIEITAQAVVKIDTGPCPVAAPAAPTAEKPAAEKAKAEKELPFTGTDENGLFAALAFSLVGGSIFATSYTSRGRRFLASSDVTADEVDGDDTN